MTHLTIKINTNTNLPNFNYHVPINTLTKITIDFYNIRNINFLDYIFYSLIDKYLLIYDEYYGVYYSQAQKFLLLERYIENIPVQNKIKDSYTKNYYQNFLNNLCFYTNLYLVELFNTKISLDLQREHTFKYNDDLEYNFMKSALANNKLEIVSYLVKVHKFSFWNNFTHYSKKKFNRKDRNMLKEILTSDNIVNYLLFDDTDIDNYFTHLLDGEMVIFILQQIIEYFNTETNNSNKLDNRNVYMFNILVYYLNKENYKVTTYILGSKCIDNTMIDEYDWIEYFGYILYDKYGAYKDNLNKSKITYAVLKNYPNSPEGINSENPTNSNPLFDNIINLSCLEFGDTILSTLIKYPKIIPCLKLLLPESLNILDISNIAQVFCNLIRYGTYETFTYLKNEIIKYLDSDSYIYDVIISYGLRNKDIRIIQDIFKILTDKKSQSFIDVFNSYNKVTFKFLSSTKLTMENKQRKIKLFLKYYNLDTVKKLITDYLLEINDIPLKKWIFKKIFNDSFYPKTVSEYYVLKILSSVLKERDLNFLEYFLQRVSKFFSMWKFVSMALHMKFFWFDKYIQKILSLCPPLKNQSKNIKHSILKNLMDIKHYSYTVKLYEKEYAHIHKLENYIKIVKYLQDNDVNLEMKINNYHKFIIFTVLNLNDFFLKALIICGVPFKPLIEYNNLYYNYSTYNFRSKIFSWFCLYRVIKRLEFRQKFRSYKKHQLHYRDTMIDLVARPPLDKPVLKEGGYLYYRDLDEMDNLFENENIEFKKATHIEPLELISILQRPNDLCFAQKVDGILQKNIDISNLYPPVSDKYENVKLDGEYFPELDITFIFGSRSNYTQRNTILEDYLELRNEHPIASIASYSESVISNSDYTELVRLKFKQEIIDIYKFCQQNKDIPGKWWPKTIYSLPNQESSRKLEILQILQDYQKQIYDENCKQNTYSENQEIPMDGIILMSNQNRKEIYKLKPLHYLTADLKFDNYIYRCLFENGKWEKKEIRQDKKYPNPQTVVNKLEKMSSYPWCLEDIKMFLGDSNYYQKNNIYDKNIKEFINLNKKLTERFLTKNILENINSNETVLDLGCGYTKNCLWKNNAVNIDGLDKDMKLLLHNTNSQNKNIYYQDLTQSWTPIINPIINYYQEINKSIILPTYQRPYDYIIGLMSLHHVFENEKTIKTFMTEINSRSRLGTKLIISHLDKDILFQNTQKHEFPDGSFMCLQKNSTLKYYYSWRHQKIMEEPIISHQNIVSILGEWKWKLQTKTLNPGTLTENPGSLTENPGSLTENPWSPVIKSFTILEFIKV